VSHDRVYQRLRSHLAYLKLPAAAEALAGKLDAAQKAKPSYTAFTEDLLGVEVEATERRRMAGRLRFAHFPVIKRLEDFDFDAQPDLDRGLVEDLATLRFVGEKANVLMVGPPGVGKTMLALALGLKAVEAGYRVYYTTAADLVARCHKAAIEGRWATTMRFFAGPQRSIASWGEIFSDSMMAAAILDRFLYRATLLAITGDSYRMRAHRERLNQLREGVAATLER